MSDAATIAAALALRAEDVCRHYLSNGRREGRQWRVGDLRNTPGRSLVVWLDPLGRAGKWRDYATDKHGDLLDLIRGTLGLTSLREAIDEAQQFLGGRAAVPSLSPLRPRHGARSDGSAAARRLFESAQGLAGTHADHYLRARRISVGARFPALRYHPRVAYRDEITRAVTYHPALLAAVTTLDGTVTGVQRLYLDRDRPAKASVAQPRKSLGNFLGQGVRLGLPTDQLVVGEGLETVLSVVEAMPELAAGAALSSHLADLALPPGLRHLIIAVDNDAEGRRAAMRLRNEVAATGIIVTELIPIHGDFNDDLRQLGRHRLAQNLHRQLG